MLNQKRERLSNVLWQGWITENSFLVKKAGNFCPANCCLKMASEAPSQMQAYTRPFSNSGGKWGLPSSTSSVHLGKMLFQSFCQAFQVSFHNIQNMFTAGSPHKHVHNHRLRQRTHFLLLVGWMEKWSFSRVMVPNNSETLTHFTFSNPHTVYERGIIIIFIFSLRKPKLRQYISLPQGQSW